MNNSKILLLLICIATSSVCGMNNKFQPLFFPLPKDISQSVQNAKKNPNLRQGYFLNNNQENKQNQYNINNINQLNSNSRELGQPSLTPTRDVNSNDIVSPNPTPGNSRRSSLKKSSSTELIEKNSENSPFEVLCSKIDLVTRKLESLEFKMEKSLQNHGKNEELGQAKELFRKIQEMNTNYENKLKESKLQEELQQEKVKYEKDLGDLKKTNIQDSENFKTILEKKENEHLKILNQKNQEIEQKNIEIDGYKTQLIEENAKLKPEPSWYKQPHTTFIFGLITCHFISNPQLYLWGFVKTTSFLLRGIANLASRKEVAPQ